MSKKENEAVVNRFLLSTVYIMAFEMLLYIMHKAAYGYFGISILLPGPRTALLLSGAGIALLVAIYFGYKNFVLKENSLYHFILFIIVMFSFLFLKFYYIFSLSFLNSVDVRYKGLAIVYLLIYIYEIVVYFLRVNK